MMTRRNILIGAAASVAGKAAVPWVSAPHIVRAANLMVIRGATMPVERNYYGFVDRLNINDSYRSGALRGKRLLQLIDEGILRHIPPAYLAYDLARWGIGSLSLSARQERREFFDWVPAPRSRLEMIDSGARGLR